MNPARTSDSSAAPASFREKSAWLCLLTSLVFYVPYFIYVARLAIRHELTAEVAIGGFVGAVAFQVIVLIIAHIGLAIVCKHEPKDERDILIESRAVQKAYALLSYSCLPAMVCILLLSAAPSPRPWEQFVTAAFISQVLLLCFAAAETARQLSQALAYRRGL